MQMLRALYSYRAFIAGSIVREFQAKYRNSLLGALWSILNPIAMIAVYTVIFSQIMRAKLPGVDSTFAYSIYLCSGILTWSLFSELTNRCINIFLDHANLIKKINFPRLCLPLIVLGSALLNFTIIFGFFTLFLVLSGNFPGWSFIAIFPILLIQMMFAMGLGLSLGILNVFFRDIGPEQIRQVIELNPLTQLITAYQNILVHNLWPDWSTLWPVGLVAVLLCLWCLRLFRRRSGELVDEL